MLQNVGYLTSNGHVHELYSQVGGGTWSHIDLTQAAAAPDGVANVLTSWADLKNQHVGFMTAIGTIGALSSPIGGGVWTYIDLIQAAHAPIPGPATLTSWADPHYQHVIYETGDRHLHELFSPSTGGTWTTGDLTTATRAPLADERSRLTSWWDKIYQHVVYFASGHVQELHYPIGGGTWATADLTAATGAPAVQTGGPLNSWADPKFQHVICLGDGRVQHLYFPIGGGAWVYEDLTAASGVAMLGVGALTAWAGPSFQHVIAVDSAGHVHDLSSPIGGGAWTHSDLTTAAAAPLAWAQTPLTSWADQNFQHVIYQSSGDGHLHELYSAPGGGAWAHSDLTTAAAAPSAAPSSITSWAPPTPIGNLSVTVTPTPAPGVQQNYVFTITDTANGSAVPGAVVTLINGPADGGGEQTSDAKGQASFPGVTLIDVLKLD
jgi:hypothetical protein